MPANRNMCPYEIDSKVNEFCEAIKETMSAVIPMSTMNRGNIIILPLDILDLIKHKKSMRRRWERFRSIAGQLKNEIKLLTQIINQRITITHNAQWTNTLSSIKPGPSMFRKIQSFGRPSRQSQFLTLIPASIWHRQLQLALKRPTCKTTASQKSTASSQIDLIWTHQDASSRTSADSTTFNAERHLVSASNFKTILKSRANKKNCGHGQIPYIVLRELSHNCIIKIAILFN